MQCDVDVMLVSQMVYVADSIDAKRTVLEGLESDETVNIFIPILQLLTPSKSPLQLIKPAHTSSLKISV